ncbi:MFS transporter [Paraburkholderia sp. UCT31]|uniref:MFS transporter n=1 Tax=Paraburkholderia sp. UCT31 TaxID=2615209 RepID=UPI00165589DF|nr:MFS transporter [Paraburkholderia sp. UCT31]MBC8736449.1 MFS transporter [Paraburkholderia sp. UCT31]
MMVWFESLSKNEKKAFAGAFMGHAVDVYDFMIYSFLIPVLAATWHMNKAVAGSIVTYTLIASLVGAIGAGLLADRFGRVRILRWTIVLFALACFACGFANSPLQLALFRMLQGLGFGGESSLCMVLVTEIIRNPAHRGKFSGFAASSYSFGWAAAAIVYSVLFSWLPAEWAWRGCFFIGIVPALLVVYLRRDLKEPEAFSRALGRQHSPAALEGLRRVCARPLAGKTILCSLLSGGMLGSYYAIATWMPTYLKLERGLSIFGTSTYLAIMILGSFVGYVLGAYSSDRIGRRLTYIVFAAGAFSMALAYMAIPASNGAMLVLGFLLGVLMQGTFSGIAATISESYPNEIRATGYGVAYNMGRVIGSLFPLGVGWLSTGHMALDSAIPLVAGVGYLCVIVTAWILPETNGISLDSLGGEQTDSSASIEPMGVAARVAQSGSGRDAR